VQELRRRFDQLDLDGNGHVTASELYLMFKALKVPVSQSTLDKLIKEADTNQNGEIEFDEFIAVSYLFVLFLFFSSSFNVSSLMCSFVVISSPLTMQLGLSC
jgi:hypothetical protein